MADIITGTDIEVADRLRELVSYASSKLDDENSDRQLILEDLLHHLLDAASTLDGRATPPELAEWQISIEEGC